MATVSIQETIVRSKAIVHPQEAHELIQTLKEHGYGIIFDEAAPMYDTPACEYGIQIIEERYTRFKDSNNVS
jgi:hypothetical protein